MTEKYLVSFLKDRYREVIDTWIDRLIQHPDSRYEQLSPLEMETICERGVGASVAFLQGYSKPSIKDLTRKLLRKKNEWNLETLDVLRYFWEFRSAVIESADMGGDAGTPDWKELYNQLDSVVETGIIHVVEELED